MKKIAALLLITLTAFAAIAQNNNPAQPGLSPAEQNIATARKLIEKNPKNYEAYNALALALSLPAWVPKHDAIVIAAFGVVTFSVIVQGLTMRPLLQYLQLAPSQPPLSRH